MLNNEESSASRLNPESKINEDKNPILETKEFIIKKENEEYHIKIEINNKYIYFTLSLADRIVDVSYQNKYDLNAIVRLLNLIPNKYNNLTQVLRFIEKAYSMNKISTLIERLQNIKQNFINMSLAKFERKNIYNNTDKNLNINISYGKAIKEEIKNNTTKINFNSDNENNNLELSINARNFGISGRLDLNKSA